MLCHMEDKMASIQTGILVADMSLAFRKPNSKGYTSLQEAVDVLTRNFVNPIYVYEGKSKNRQTVEDYCKNNNMKITISDVSQIHVALSNKGIIIYIDGSCKDNGKPSAKCSFAVFSNDFDQLSYSYNLDTPNPTNKVAELAGSIMAIKSAINLQLSCITIRTDSLYVVNSAKMYLPDRIKNNFNDISNSEMWKTYHELSTSITITLEHVNRHSGEEGNELVDKIANEIMSTNITISIDEVVRLDTDIKVHMK